MNREEFLARIGALLSAGDIPLDPDVRLADLSGWDSIGKMEFLAFLDEQFKISMEFGQLDKLVTLGDVLGVVNVHLEAR